MRRPRLATLACALLVCTEARAASETPIQLGPFTTGMTLEDARAAAPTLAWRNAEVSQYTQRPLAIRADGALALGGLSHAIEIRPGYYGAHHMKMEHSAAVADAAACERMTLPVLVELESRFGPLKGEPRYETSGGYTLPRWQTQRTSSGAVIVTPVPGSASGPTRTALPHERIKAGKRSLLIFEQDDESRESADGPAWRRGYAERAIGKARLRLESSYEHEEAARVCRISTSITRAGSPPASRTLDLDRAALERQQSVSLRHHSLDAAPTPSEDVSLRFKCSVLRAARKLSCAPSGLSSAAQPAWIEAAQSRIAELTLDDATNDPDDPTPANAMLEIVLSPRDRRSLAFATSPRAPIREIAWSRYPNDAELAAARSSGVGVATVVCEIQIDGSLVCAALDDASQAVAPGDATISQRAAVEILRRYVASSTLKTGSSSAGRVFVTSVDFR